MPPDLTEEGRPTTPPRRPTTARPRPGEGEGTPEPPSAEELAAVERHFLELARLSGAQVEPDAALGVTLVSHPTFGLPLDYATSVRWSEGEWRGRLRILEERVRERGVTPQLMLLDGFTSPPDLAARVRSLGWVSVLHETVLWTRRAAVVPHLDPWLRIEAVTHSSAAEYERVERGIFGLPERLADDRLAALKEALGGGRLRAYLVRLRGEPVATTRLSAQEGVAGLHGVGVAEDHRRRGFGTLITTVATRAALATGNRLVWLSVAEANAGARALYAALDYRPAFDWQRLVAVPIGSAR